MICEENNFDFEQKMAEVSVNDEKSNIAIIKMSMRDVIINQIMIRIVILPYKRNALPSYCGYSVLRTASSCSFIITSNEREILLFSRLIIVECVLRLFPKTLMAKDMIIYNLDTNIQVEELREIILHGLNLSQFNDQLRLYTPYVNLYYEHNMISVMDVEALWNNLTVNLYHWGFKKFIVTTVFSLQKSAFIHLTKYLIIAILKKDTDIHYFNQNTNISRLRYNIFLSNWFDRLNLFSIYSLIAYEKSYILRDEFYGAVDLLRLPMILKNELKSYFPPPNIALT